MTCPADGRSRFEEDTPDNGPDSGSGPDGLDSVPDNASGAPENASGIDRLVRFIRSDAVSSAVCLAYGAIGAALMLAGRALPQWYVVLQLFFVSKMLFDYDKCTLSYVECKLVRGVPRERGLVDSLVTAVVAAGRNPKYSPAVAAHTAATVAYYFFVQGSSIEI